MFQAVVTNRKKAAKVNASVNRALQSLKKLARLDSMVLNLALPMQEHLHDQTLGRDPGGPGSERSTTDSRRAVFVSHSLINPADESAINGIGTILFYERELKAAAFFQRRAIDPAKRRGGDYNAAQEDLRQTLRFLKANAGG